jgi:hypothetical protein
MNGRGMNLYTSLGLIPLPFIPFVADQNALVGKRRRAGD